MEESVEQLQDLQDFDNDGVIEAREKCADTVLGATINNDGCGTHTSVNEPITLDIKFANNSYEVETSAYAEIETLASYLNKYPELKVVIEGHTSEVGSTELNQTLSEERANAVSQLLVENFAIPRERLSVEGYGFNRLKQAGDTEEAHTANRRIAADLSQSTQVDDMKWTIYTVDQVQ